MNIELKAGNAPTSGYSGYFYNTVTNKLSYLLNGVEQPLTKEDEIRSWIEGIWKINKEDYEVTSDGVIIGSSTKLVNLKLAGFRNRIPVNLSKVWGNLIANGLGLTNINDIPEVEGDLEARGNFFEGNVVLRSKIGGNIDFSSNKKMTNLTLSQEIINGNLSVNNCDLCENPKGIKVINKDYDVTNNKLKTGYADFKVLGNADLSDNKIISEEGMLEVIGKLYYGNNPCQPDDNLREIANWS
jgi:hypothetical protein